MPLFGGGGVQLLVFICGALASIPKFTGTCAAVQLLMNLHNVKLKFITEYPILHAESMHHDSSPGGIFVLYENATKALRGLEH